LSSRSDSGSVDVDLLIANGDGCRSGLKVYLDQASSGDAKELVKDHYG